MIALSYKGYRIAVETKPIESGLWISNAKIQYGTERVSFTVCPYARDGYTSQGEAEEKTIIEAKKWVDGRPWDRKKE